MMYDQLPVAIVVGLDSITGLQTARILSQRGIPVIAIAKRPDHFCCRTRVCKRILQADTESHELIETLESLSTSLKEKAVLYPCSDTSVLVVSRYRHQLENNYHVVLADQDTIEMMVDKVKFYRFAQEKGLPIPKTYFLTTREDAEKVAQEITFPCVLKPPYRPEVWTQYTKSKVFKVDSSEELLALFDQYHSLTNFLIAQQWIEGPDLDHITCNCYFDTDSEPLVAFAMRKLRQWPPQAGQGCFGEKYLDGNVIRETIRLFRAVNYRGLGYLEMKRDVISGKYYIIEPNIGRPTGRSASLEANGVELLYTMYCDAIGIPLPANDGQSCGNSRGVKWIYLRQDIQSALSSYRRGELSLWEWWRSLRGPKWYAVFSWTDPWPFWYDLGRVFGLLFRNQFHKLTKKSKDLVRG